MRIYENFILNPGAFKGYSIFGPTSAMHGTGMLAIIIYIYTYIYIHTTHGWFEMPISFFFPFACLNWFKNSMLWYICITGRNPTVSAYTRFTPLPPKNSLNPMGTWGNMTSLQNLQVCDQSVEPLCHACREYLTKNLPMVV